MWTNCYKCTLETKTTDKDNFKHLVLYNLLKQTMT